MKPSLYLIDGSAIAYRSYFAMIRNRLTTSKGQPTGAIFAFFNSLKKILDDEKPDYIGIVFDAPEKTFRHKIYPEYKATREAMPDELVSQLPFMFKVIEAMNIPVLVLPGYEADDIIGTLAKQAKIAGLKVFMVTGDKDFMQIVDEDILVYKPGTAQKGIEIFGVNDVVEKWGIRPDQIPDYLGLIGDSSDNIPGVKGVGPAKAKPLLQKWDTVENVIENVDKIDNPRVAQMIKDGCESAVLSKELATIKTDVPVEAALDELKFVNVNEKELLGIFEELEFFSLIKTLRMDQTEKKVEKKNYKAILNLSELKELVKRIKNVPLLSVDLETDSIDPLKAKIVGLSLSWEPHSGVYIPIEYLSKEGQIFGDDDLRIILEVLIPILESESPPKCGQNLKYDMMVLKRYGIQLKGLQFDTMIAAFLIQPDSHSYKLYLLSQQYLHYSMRPIEDLIGKGKNQITMDQVDLKKTIFYACEDADVVFQLVPILQEKLREDRVWEVFKDVEIPLVPVLARMEESGVFLDVGHLKQMSHNLEEQIGNLVNKIYDVAGFEFNINSTKQLAEILFDKLCLPKVRSRSTDVKVLEKLRANHPLPDLILEYRGLVKLKNTYLDALPLLVNSSTGRVHSSFNQTVASTGRLSSSDPNFQNIPIRTDIGREIRKGFVPQKSGWKILSADYSQIELRIMAHLCKDVAMNEAFKENVDVHTRTAALVYGVEEKDVLPEMRRIAKIVNFGIMYGAGPYRMSEELKIPYAEAKKLVDQYFRTYPSINEYIINTLEDARNLGYVKTLAGRRRYVREIKSQNRQIREAAERAAINMPIQGTAADMIKIAMIRIHEKLIKNEMRSMMILQIHDELLFEVPDEELEELRMMVANEMENALPLDIPIQVDIGVGNSWYEAH